MKKYLVLILLTLPAAAHDFWIEPASFRPARGEAVEASLRVGERFNGDPVERPGIEYLPAGPNTLIAYQSSTFSTVTLPRDKFDAYLREEGLRVKPRTKGLQRERYRRYAKSVVGEGPLESAKALGWRFELVPLARSRFQLLYEGKPLRDALINARSRTGAHLSVRTGGDGTVSLDLAGGVWLVTSVHMIAAPAGSGFDWESLWASLTFEK